MPPVPEFHLPQLIHMQTLNVFSHCLEATSPLQPYYSLQRQGSYQLNALTPESKFSHDVLISKCSNRNQSFVLLQVSGSLFHQCAHLLLCLIPSFLHGLSFKVVL